MLSEASIDELCEAVIWFDDLSEAVDGSRERRLMKRVEIQEDLNRLLCDSVGAAEPRGAPIASKSTVGKILSLASILRTHLSSDGTKEVVVAWINAGMPE